jgi:hypothetical protein
MNDPTRLLEAGDEFERALLDSARRDRASERAKVRALTTFGALGLQLTASTAAASPSAFAAAASSGVLASSAPALTTVAFAKWLGTGMILGTLSAGSVYAIRTESNGTTVPYAATSTVPVTVSPALERTAQTAAPEPRPDAVAREPHAVSHELDSVSANDPSARTPPGPAASNGAFPLDTPDSHLRAELAALDRARRALRGGNPAVALQELARYEARFPRGALLQEATLLAVEARLEAGDTSGARAVAARVLTVDTTSPHARRLQALLSKKGTP